MQEVIREGSKPSALPLSFPRRCAAALAACMSLQAPSQHTWMTCLAPKTELRLVCSLVCKSQQCTSEQVPALRSSQRGSTALLFIQVPALHVPCADSAGFLPLCTRPAAGTRSGCILVTCVRTMLQVHAAPARAAGAPASERRACVLAHARLQRDAHGHRGRHRAHLRVHVLDARAQEVWWPCAEVNASQHHMHACLTHNACTCTPCHSWKRNGLLHQLQHVRCQKG